MKYGLLWIALFIAATALTSSERRSAHATPTTTSIILTPPKTTTHSPNTTTHSPNTTTHSPNTTTHSPNTTTHSPNTTTHSPNTTTHSPNTTTHSPNTTTHSPNTTTHSPNTTTHSPNTTTHSPTTTSAPVPVPTPSTNLTVGKYNVSNEKGICVMLDMAVEIRVNTSKANGTFIVQPSKTSVTGECLEFMVNISLNFDEGVISLRFNKNDKKVFVESIKYKLTYAFQKGDLSNFEGLNRSLNLFSVDLGNSYSCKADTINMGNGVSLDLTQYRFQAFNIKNNVFGPPELCKADQPDYRVPIAVGIILIILIVIVVIAYLISRKRRTDGYQSL